MTLVADLLLESGAFPLTDVASAVPAAAIRIEHILVGSGDSYALIARVQPSSEAVELAFDASAGVENWTVLGDDTEGRFYRIELADDFVLYEAALGLDVAPMWADVLPTGWRKRGRYPNRAALAAFCATCEAAGVRYQLERLTESTSDTSTYGLTDRQRLALRTAHEAGYFDTPRRTSTRELGTRLGISAASVSELLRRAQRRLVEHTVLTGINGLTG
jgi:hypothetical protein